MPPGLPRHKTSGVLAKYIILDRAKTPQAGWESTNRDQAVCVCVEESGGMLSCLGIQEAHCPKCMHTFRITS